MRRSLSLLIILVGLLALWGCSKKNPVQTGNLNQGQEAAFAKETGENATRVTGFVGSFSGGLGSTPDTAKPFGGPAFLPPSQTFNPPDSSWHGPYPNPHQPPDSTWYWKRWAWTDTMGTFTDTVYVKFTPNIWDFLHARDTVTHVDWEGLIYWTNPASNTSTSLDETAGVGYSGGGTVRSKTDGNFRAVGTVKTGGTTIAHYDHKFTWTNCDTSGWRGTSRTCNGQINWEATSTYVAVTYDLKGFYTFNNGTGDGEAQFKNLLTGSYVTFAKLHFNNYGSGYYTLLSEDWKIAHPFFW